MHQLTVLDPSNTPATDVSDDNDDTDGNLLMTQQRIQLQLIHH